MTAKEAREFVLSKWKDAELVGYPDGDYAIFSREAGHASGTGYIGWGQTKYNVRVADEAWIDAARNLPTPVEPKAQVESASVEKVDVFEVYGASARERGWDFLVCKTIKDVLAYVESDIDGLEDGEEVKIVFRQYTKEQMDEVIYE